MNVLIIDDDKAIRLFVEAFFDEAGHNTTVADCGETALDLYDKQHFDLIVTDVVMSGLDGFQTVDIIRKRSIEWIPVIFMTSNKEDDALQKGINAGGGFYLPKPLKPTLIKLYIDVMEKINDMRTELTYKAKYDELTGLPNRNLFNDRLNTSIKRSQRTKTKIAILFMDLDHFKSINDLMGHSAGDALLVETARRLQDCVRDSDTVCRNGGDEFVIMLPDLENIDGIDVVVNNILTTLAKPFLLGDKQNSFISASIGVSVYPDDASDVESLYKTSDTAMYKAKDEGRNNCYYYNQELGDSVYKRTVLSNELRQAIEEQQLEIYYQPQVDCNKYMLSGMEALLRWKHPKLGMVSPFVFIPIAEETGLITEIGIWIIKTVCNQIKEWQASGYKVPRVSINLSPRQLKDKDLEANIINIIKEANIDFNSLALEITESCVMDNPEETIEILTRLKQLGLKISMDDFGTGYSSMSYLKKLPLDQLKIDREFIRYMPDAVDDCEITKTIVTLGHSLGLSVIAEGVETSAQLKYLKNENCDEIQGYLFGKPQTADEISAILKDTETLSDANVPSIKIAR